MINFMSVSKNTIRETECAHFENHEIRVNILVDLNLFQGVTRVRTWNKELKIRSGLMIYVISKLLLVIIDSTISDIIVSYIIYSQYIQ